MAGFLRGESQSPLYMGNNLDSLLAAFLVQQTHQVLGSLQVAGPQLDSFEPMLFGIMLSIEAIECGGHVCDGLNMTAKKVRHPEQPLDSSSGTTFTSSL